MTFESKSPPEAVRLVRLEQFLRWAIPCDFIFAALQVIAGLLFRDGASCATAVVMFGYGALLLFAQRETRMGRLSAAIALICYGLFAADVLIAFVQPILMPTLAIVPLLGVAVALPYVSGSVLRRFIGIAGLTTGVVVVFGTLLPLRSQLPALFLSLFSLSSLLSVISLVLLLLWQFSSRLTDTLARTRAAEERYSLAARGANDGLWDWDLAAGTVYYSARWKAMLGYHEAAIGGRPEEWLHRIHAEDHARVVAELGVHCEGLTTQFESEHRLRDANGRYRWVLARGLAVSDAAGRATRMAGSLTDITVRKTIEAQLLYDARHDALTGLPNRALFMQQLERAVKRAHREPGYRFAVLYIDLDRFKVVNDSLGHSAGDDLLVELAHRLRAVAAPDDTVARLGGDEFAFLLNEIDGPNAARRVAEQIQDAVKTPFYLQNNALVSAISIGIAMSDAGYELPEQVLRDADTALYRAKAQGRGRHVLFSGAMHRDAVELLQVEMDLRQAIERREFVVYYQPIVSLKSGRITGVEALVRWQHPTRGLLEPAEFIGFAEETGLIAPMGWIVLREACRQARLWAYEVSADPPLTMSVNVSGTQFAHPELADRLRALFAEAAPGVLPLQLEITEAVMLNPAAFTPELLSLLRELGIGLQIDDFGTGYASLTLLHQYPVRGLKIDRTFIRRLGQDQESVEMVAAIIAFAHRLGLEVTAEGIETVEKLELLRRLGCDYGQGHFFSPAVCARDAASLLFRPVIALNSREP